MKIEIDFAFLLLIASYNSLQARKKMLVMFKLSSGCSV